MQAVRHVGPIPQIGFGTGSHDPHVGYEGVLCALEVGYRHIDTAEGYRNEDLVGRAIAESGVPRSEIFLTTKVAPESFGPGQIMPHVRASLERLQVEQVDLLLLHWPSIKDEYAMEDYMAQFAEVHEAGLTRHIGVSNFTKRHLDRAIELLGDRPIITHQCEIHVFMQNRTIVDCTRSKGIPMTAYCPLAQGQVGKNEVLREIGQAHGATPEQVALAFLMAEDHVVIPSSSRPERIASNFAAKDLVLSSQETDKIRHLDEGRRLMDGPWAPEWDR